MSFINKLKDVSNKASDVVANEYHKQQEKAAERKEEKAQKLAAEEERKNKIVNGRIEPITVTMGLQEDERAYLVLTANRMASVDSVVQQTVGSSKKKHVIRRGLVGGVLLGPVGLVAGAATAGSKNTSTTFQKTVSTVQQVDSGEMILTNKRFIFVGNNNVISLPYPEIIATSFNNNSVTVKYAGMLNGEFYKVFGDAAKDTQLYYSGITQHLHLKMPPPSAS